jgi:Uma2 family endonuclease
VLDERDVTPRRWTRAEYDRMVEVGLLTDDDRVELVDGEILTVTPHNSPHATTIGLVNEALRVAFGQRGHLRLQLPLSLDAMSAPEPDLSVVEGSLRDYRAGHPETALLVVEVADTTLSFARRKGGLYARAGIPEYWIVNLRDRCLEVHRIPETRSDATYGAAYRVVRQLGSEATVSPLAASGAAVAVVDLLP